MAKATLPTNYQDDVLKSTMGGKRRYTMTDNSDGTKTLEDATQYDKVGSNFGASDINKTNTAVNAAADASKIIDNVDDIKANTQSGYMMGALAGKQLIQNLGALNDSGAIKGMDAREDGVYITYSTGADTVTKKLGNLGNTSYIQAEPTYRRVAAEFDVSDCNKILFTCKTSGSAIWFMGSNESTYVINTGTSLGFCTSSANETKEYDVSSYKYFRVEMLGSGIVQNIKFS